MNKTFKPTRTFVAIEGRALSNALKLMTAVIERRNTYPILGMVRLAVSGPALAISGTDLDIFATTTLDVNDAGGEWAACVEVGTLASIARLAGPEIVKIERVEKVTDIVLRIAVGDTADYELAALASDTFPELPGTRGAELERFPNGRLAELFRKVAWCISTEETRYYLNGVAWQWNQRGRRMVATDNYRVVICRYVGSPSERERTRIIPRKTVAVLARAAAGQDVAVHAVVPPNAPGDLADDPLKLDFAFGATVLRSKMVEGTYPDVDRVIPKKPKYAFAFKGDMEIAIERATAIGRRGMSAVAFRCRDGAVSLERRSPDVGEASVRLDAEWPEGANEVGFNARYLKEAIAHCSGPVTIHQVDAGTAHIISDGDETMLRLLMPMRV